MKKEKFTYNLFGIYVLITIIIFILSFTIDLTYDGKIKLIEIILSSSSISMGFFGTIFTFIFGLKNNNIYNLIMKNPKSKLQFKILNLSLIILGFGIIIMCVVMIVFLYDQNYNLFKIINISTMLIFSLLILYYLMFCTYLFVLAKLVFRDNNNEIGKINSPKIIKGVAKRKLENQNRE